MPASPSSLSPQTQDPGSVPHLHRIRPPTHHHNRTTPKMLRKPLRINRRRRHHHLQIRPLRQQLLQIPQQKINVQRPLMRLINNQRIIRIQKPIPLRLRQQNPIRHQLDVRPLRHIDPKTESCIPPPPPRASPTPPRSAPPRSAPRSAAAAYARSSPPPHAPSPDKIFGNCVVFPLPVSPHTTTT